MMFEFLEMMFDYEDRLVENTKINGAEIDTVKVNDIDAEYETGIKHKDYNNGEWIIVEEYYTIEEAKCGHKRWCEVFKKGMPVDLIDVSSTVWKKILNEMSEQNDER